MTTDFFKFRREWSRWKHRLLERYLGTFSGIVGSAHQVVYYIDGFAGEGRYQDPPEDGSPIIAARIASDVAVKPRNFTLKCINIEPNGYAQLCDATASYDTSLVRNLRGTFAENLESVLRIIGNHPALFFLDPCGHKGMEWDVLMQVVARARTAITEVLLNFYITRIDVHAGYVRSEQTQARKFVAGLDALFGTEDWRSVWESTPDREQRLLRLTDLYMNRLADAFVRTASDGFSSRYAVKTIDDDLKYFMVHGTRSLRGARAMSEAVFRVTMEYEDAKASAAKAALEASRQRLLFEPAGPPSQADVDNEIMRSLSPCIAALRLQQRRFTLAELEETLIREWFGRAVEKHYRGACIHLVKDGKARLLGPNGVVLPTRSGRIVIGRDTIVELI